MALQALEALKQHAQGFPEGHGMKDKAHHHGPGWRRAERSGSPQKKSGGALASSDLWKHSLSLFPLGFG